MDKHTVSSILTLTRVSKRELAEAMSCGECSAVVIDPAAHARFHYNIMYANDPNTQGEQG